MKEEKRLLQATAVFLIRDGKVLLAQKTRHIGEGRWNGYGGGVELGESLVDCVIRELGVETKDPASKDCISVAPKHLAKMAVVDFHNQPASGLPFTCRVHMFIAWQWKGEAHETEEMVHPTWFQFNQLPFEQMMPADRYWLPPMLKGRKLYAEAHYGPRQATLLKPVKISFTDALPEE